MCCTPEAVIVYRNYNRGSEFKYVQTEDVRFEGVFYDGKMD